MKEDRNRDTLLAMLNMLEGEDMETAAKAGALVVTYCRVWRRSNADYQKLHDLVTERLRDIVGEGGDNAALIAAQAVLL